VSGEFDVAADLATGALVARAVEPDSGEAAIGERPHCLNCSASLTGKFCAACGQSGQVHRSLHAFWHDFLHSILHFDGKIWRTLPLLVVRPGKLTYAYVHGERVRFVSPLALFLFSVFAMFAVFSWVGGPISPKANTMRNGVALAPQAIAAELNAQRAELAVLEKRIVPGQSVPGALQIKIDGLKENIQGLETGAKLANGISTNDLDLDLESVNTGNKALDAKIRHAFENPQLLLYKVQSNAYKFSWLLVPLSLPFVWLLFAWRRGHHLYDHLVFITYSLCFMTFLLVVMAFLGKAGPLKALQGPLLGFAPALHIFAHVRGAYGLSIGGAIWRTGVLLIAACVVLMLFAIILLTTGVS
jgi:Protein of unknown function (DUF3667)